MQTTEDPQPLSRQTRIFIVATALVQGALLYLLRYGQEQGWWLASMPGWRVFSYTLILAVPGMMALSVVRLGDPRFWQHVVALGVMLTGLAAWATWNASGAPGLDQGAILAPFTGTITIGVFVSIAWLQARQRHESWRVPYSTLFECAWQNALTLLLAAGFTAICWGVLMLWAELFKLLDIRFFYTLFQRSDFTHLATGTMAGLGILIGRTQHRPVQIARQILFAVFKGLLPLLALIALMFIVSLPFTGLEPLWKTRWSAFSLLLVVVLMALFTNAVYQDGERDWPYPIWLRRVVEAALLTLPVYAALALYALGVRIQQYGWTTTRIWGGLAALLTLGYALGYAASTLRSRGRWLQPLAGVNKVLSWAVIGVVVLANSPLIDVFRITVNSQIQRLRNSVDVPDKSDLMYLRFQAGRLGYQALQGLRTEPAMVVRGRERMIDEVLGRSRRWGSRQDEVHLIDDVATLRQHIVLAEGSTELDAQWWQQLATGALRPRVCRQPLKECIARRQDFNGNGREEVLLCEVQSGYRSECWMHALDDEGHWRNAGTVGFLGHGYPGGTTTLPLREALRQGRLETRRQRWPELSLDGGRPNAVDDMRLVEDE